MIWIETRQIKYSLLNRACWSLELISPSLVISVFTRMTYISSFYFCSKSGSYRGNSFSCAPWYRNVERKQDFLQWHEDSSHYLITDVVFTRKGFRQRLLCEVFTLVQGSAFTGKVQWRRCLYFMCCESLSMDISQWPNGNMFSCIIENFNFWRQMYMTN